MFNTRCILLVTEHIRTLMRQNLVKLAIWLIIPIMIYDERITAECCALVNEEGPTLCLRLMIYSIFKECLVINRGNSACEYDKMGLYLLAGSPALWAHRKDFCFRKNPRRWIRKTFWLGCRLEQQTGIKLHRQTKDISLNIQCI